MAIINDEKQNIILTVIGEQLKTLALDGGSPIDLMYIAVGDANGASNFKIDTEQTNLINELWRGRIVSLQDLENDDEGFILVSGYIPIKEYEANFLKEFGLFDRDNRLIYVGRLNNFYKPSISSKDALPIILQIKIPWDKVGGLTMSSANEYMYATKAELSLNDANQTPKSSSYLYYISGPGRRKTQLSSSISNVVRKIDSIYDAQSISSGQILIVTSPVTIPLPLFENCTVTIKRVYETGEDTIITTDDKTVTIEDEEFITLSMKNQSYTLFCDGEKWYRAS